MISLTLLWAVCGLVFFFVYWAIRDEVEPHKMTVGVVWVIGGPGVWLLSALLTIIGWIDRRAQNRRSAQARKLTVVKTVTRKGRNLPLLGAVLKSLGAVPEIFSRNQEEQVGNENKGMSNGINAARRDTIIQIVMHQWKDRPYALVEKASDAAVKAFDEGKSLAQCVNVARAVIEGK